MDQITEKYRDKVTPEYRMAIEAISFARLTMRLHRDSYETLIKAENDMHNYAGLLDPTLYRDMLKSKTFPLQIRMVKAALKFLDEIDAVNAEVDKLG